ncbi:TIR domain-containing protein [Aurantiacibacter flavus]|uniref:TIR domain-containing protein n=1 Tax=Aurantiacibacter flavus TaxID=3145232 RepID=A0ABV0D0P7_9SPHN
MARKTFFSFHYSPDCWRAWNVRNSWEIKGTKEGVGFFDNSVFEASKKEGDDALKRFLREGLANTSVTCVLAGSETSARRWVRYEIARSVIKGNGLLTVDIHGVKNSKGFVATKGTDPLALMGLYRTVNGIYLAEAKGGKWVKYGDYTRAIPENDLWFTAPATDTVVPFSRHCSRYDFANQDGRNKLGGWIEVAAKQAGR